jgi:Flp pilus assembly pilin Flp
MACPVSNFLRDERGAVSVDWTVLSAAAVSMSLATVGVLNGGIETLVSRLESELRNQQLSDNFITFTSAHFEPMYENGVVTAEVMDQYFMIANDMMNHQVIDALEYGLTALEAGALSPEDIVALAAVGSVAYQRNIVDDGMLDYYFGFNGEGSPRYADALPTAGTYQVGPPETGDGEAQTY